MATATLMQSAFVAGLEAVSLAAWRNTRTTLQRIKSLTLDSESTRGLTRRFLLDFGGLETTEFSTLELREYTQSVVFMVFYGQDGRSDDANAQAADDAQRLIDAMTPLGNAAMTTALGANSGDLYHLVLRHDGATPVQQDDSDTGLIESRFSAQLRYRG